MVKDPVSLGEVRRALVIKLRHHGDVLLSAPVFSALKAAAPHVEIDALVYADTAEMLSLHPDIAQVHTIDRHWKKLGPLGQLRAEWALLRTLRGRGYDLVVHLTEHPRGAWLTRLVGARWGVAPKAAARSRFLRESFTHLYSQPRSTWRHTVEKNLDALRRIGIQPGPQRALTLVPGDAATHRVDGLLAAAGIAPGEFIHVHPASRWQFKCWPAERMAALIGRLQAEGRQVVLSGAPSAAEQTMVAAIQDRLAKPAADLTGQLSLKELAALATRARLFVGVDSAPMHIAAAVGTPTVAIFGPSGAPEWGPWAVPHRIVASQRHICLPCGIDGCGGGKVSECLETLEVDRVHEAVVALLEETSSAREIPTP